MSRLEQLERLHAADPEDPDLAYMIAHEHLKAGNTPAATYWFDTCLKLNPSYHYAYFHKARVLQGSGDIQAAADTLRLGLALAERDGNAKAAGEIAALLNELGA